MISTASYRFVTRWLGKLVEKLEWDVNNSNQYGLAQPMLRAEYGSQIKYGAGQDGAFPPVYRANVLSEQVVFRGVFLPEAVDNEAWRQATLPNLDIPS